MKENKEKNEGRGGVEVRKWGSEEANFFIFTNS